MPFVEEQQGGELPAPRLGLNAPPPDPFAQGPATADVISAAFRRENPIASVLDSIGRMPGNAPTPGYNPLDTLRGTPHEGDDLSLYAGSQNEAHTRALMAQKDREDADRRTLAESGHAGTVAALAAGLLDPAFAIPIVGTTGAGPLIGAARLGAYGAGVGAVSEAALQASQVFRPWQESAHNIASGAILMGVLGAAGGYWSRGEATSAAKALDEVRPRIDAATGDLIPQAVPQPAAGAAVTDTRQLELKGALGLERLVVSPNTAIYNASSVEARRAMKDLAETGLRFKDDGTGQVSPFGPNLESQSRVLTNGFMQQAERILDDAWKQHYFGENQPGKLRGFAAKEVVGAPSTADKLGFGDFDRAVGAAMHNGDVHEIPEVQQAAQELRAKVFDPIKKAAQETLDKDGRPMLGAELDAPNGATSFFPLMSIREAIIAKRYEVEKLFTDFLEREQADKFAAQTRLRALVEKGATASPEEQVGIHAQIKEELAQWRGNSAKGNPADAVERILASDRTLSRQELASRAQQWVDRVIGSPDGRLAYDDAATGTRFGSDDARGSLVARKTPIDVNELISRGLINTSATHGVASLSRTIIPDMLLTRRFGDVSMTDVMRKINEEYSAKQAGVSEAASIKLGKERDSVIAALAGARDRLRHIYGWDTSPQSRKYGAMIRDMQNINALRALGTSAFSRATDLSNAVFRYGMLNVFKDGWVPFFQGLTDPALRKIIREQARDAGVGIDGLLGHLRQNFADINMAYMPGNKFSSGLAWSTDKSMLLNLHGPLTDFSKQMVFNVAQGELGRMVARVVAGTATKRDLAYLADMSIGHEMAVRIARQYDQHAIEVSGRRFADAPNWTDRGAKMAFEAAMSREGNISVLQAGIGDKPMLMDKGLFKLVLQFKTFLAAAHEKILLSNLQKRDARSVEGAIASLGLGLLGTAAYKVSSGQEIGTDPREWIKEALDRAAMVGWFADANNHLSRLTSGSLDFNRLYGAGNTLTRRRDLSLLGELGGPSVDIIEKLAKTAEHTQGGTFGGGDVHNLRVALPLQNLWAFRRALDAIERGADSAFGLQPPKSVVH